MTKLMPLLDKIEHRKLTREELQRLMNEAESSETKFLKELTIEPFCFFNDYSLIQDGLVIDDRPIYIAALMQDSEGNLFGY